MRCRLAMADQRSLLHAAKSEMAGLVGHEVSSDEGGLVVVSLTLEDRRRAVRGD